MILSWGGSAKRRFAFGGKKKVANKMYEPKSILQMARGAFQERVDVEMARVIENIMDSNTKPTQKRKLTLTIELTPDDNRQNILVGFTVKTALAPMVPAQTSLWVAGQDKSGGIQVVEMVPQVPGQMSMDGTEQEAPASLKIIKIS